MSQQGCGKFLGLSRGARPQEEERGTSRLSPCSLRQAVRANWCAYAILHPSIRHLPSGERGSRLCPAYTSNLSTRASERSAYLKVPMPAQHWSKKSLTNDASLSLLRTFGSPSLLPGNSLSMNAIAGGNSATMETL